jgi:hypothetical protein
MLKFDTWPTCPECGCRLKIDVVSNKNIMGYDSGLGMLKHFGPDSHKDARGHTCKRVADSWTAEIKQVEKYI